MTIQDTSPSAAYKSDSEATPTLTSSVTVFTSKSGLRVVNIPSRGYTPFMVRFPKTAGVKAGRRYYKTLEAAKDDIDGLKESAGSSALGKKAADDYLYCASLLGDTPLYTAVRFYLDNVGDTSSATLGDLAALHTKKLAKKSKVYNDRAGRTLKALLLLIDPKTKCSTLTSKYLIKFLEGIENYWTREAMTKCLCALFSIGMKPENGLVKYNPIAGWRPEKPMSVIKKICVLPVDDAEDLLEFVEGSYPEYLPAFAIQLFAGIRTEEICREVKDGRRPLDWSDITLGKQIIVPACVAKTKEERVVDQWPSKLTTWLSDYVKTEGPVMPFITYGNIKSRIVAEYQKLRKGHGQKPITWGQNILRHSYASYGVAYFQSANTVALQMGHHNSNLLFKHYRTHANQEDAKRLFGTMKGPVHNQSAA